ncbi:MAG: leucine-rich repeat domain-containing protein [Roseburia sp.]
MKEIRKGIMVLLTACIILGCMPAVQTHAETTTDESGFTVDDTGTLIAYTGPGGAITIPSNVTSIAGGVFASNTSISSVSIPATVTSMGTAVFYDCTGLTSVSVDANISSIPSQTFYNCTSLSSVSLNSSISAIGSQAFAECSALSSISLPSTVSSIGEKAFYDCSALSGITIPAAVTSIGGSAFDGCGRLGSISVAAGSGTYASSDGCLYNKSLTRLIRCPQGKSGVTLASTTQTIGSGAFDSCRSVTSLALPEAVTTIEANAFTGSGITSITIPATTTSIGTQSNWKPSSISGYTNSQAKIYADANNITFRALDADPVVQQPSQDSGISGSPATPSGETAPTGDGNSSTEVTVIPGPTVSPATATTTGGTATAAGGTTASDNSGATVTSDSHEKDDTPKTGDGINPVFYMCFAVLLAGICCFLFRKKTV